VTSRLAALLVVVLATRVHAAPLVIAALAPGDRDARTAVVIGPSGQAYEPDGKGAWTRHHASAIADNVARATRAGSVVIVGSDTGPSGGGPSAAQSGASSGRGRASDPSGLGPPYAFRAGVWDLVVLGLHAKAVLGRGPRATAAFGRQVFGLETGKPVRLADAPGPVAMLGAGIKAIVVETDQGLAKNEGKGWKPIANAPKQVEALLDDRWALVDHGLLDLRSQKLTAWPAGFHVASAVAIDNDFVVAVGLQGAAAELVTLKAGKLDHEAIVVADATANADAIATSTAKLGTGAAAIVGVAADRTGRVVVAARDGQLAIRDKAGAWTRGALFDPTPPARPGSPPAESK